MNSYQGHMLRTPSRVLTYPCSITKPPTMHLLVLLQVHANRNNTTILCSSSLNDDSFSIPKPTKAHPFLLLSLFSHVNHVFTNLKKLQRRPWFCVFVASFFMMWWCFVTVGLQSSRGTVRAGGGTQAKVSAHYFLFIYFIFFSCIAINHKLVLLYECEFWALVCLILVIHGRNVFA